MRRCMCGSKPKVCMANNGDVEIYCDNCTRPHAFGATKRDARKEWNRLCNAERKNWEQHHLVTGN